MERFVSEYSSECDTQAGMVRYQKISLENGETYSMIINNKNIPSTPFYNSARSKLEHYLTGNGEYVNNLEDYFMDFCREYQADLITEFDQTYPNTDFSKVLYTKSASYGLNYPVVVVYTKKGDNYISLAIGIADSNKITEDIYQKCNYGKTSQAEFEACWDKVVSSEEYQSLARQQIQKLISIFAL